MPNPTVLSHLKHYTNFSVYVIYRTSLSISNSHLGVLSFIKVNFFLKFCTFVYNNFYKNLYCS